MTNDDPRVGELYVAHTAPSPWQGSGEQKVSLGWQLSVPNGACLVVVSVESPEEAAVVWRRNISVLYDSRLFELELTKFKRAVRYGELLREET